MIDVMLKEPQEQETYLGDGVYASFDGDMIRIWTMRHETEHFIYLERSVYDALRAYGARLWELKP